VKALIAMSGGVDSSVAAYLMQQKGYECAGCTMKLFENSDAGEDPARSCCSINDLNDARRVAELLGMPYFVFNYIDEFRKKVIDRFVNAYLDAQTPNPCIDCNRYLKFDRLLEHALMSGYDMLASGHYARIQFDGSQYHLLRGKDPSKDQSYVLYNLTQGQLAHLTFPLGEYDKDEVREIAREQGFVNAKKPDSQDICFVPDGDYARLVEERSGVPAVPGHFVDRDGNILGEHRGLIHYTIGQRRGLGLSLPAPLYVLRLNAKKNEVVLGPNEALFSHEVMVKDMNWISGKTPEAPFSAQAKIRYSQHMAAAEIFPLADGGARLVFADAQRAVTPGQSAVIYQGDEVLGGGIIM